MQSTTFGRFSFDAQQELLFEGTDLVPVGRRALRVLACLLASEGQVVSKALLINAAWGTQVVEDSNLSVQVAALRRVLGRSPDGRHWIETVERVGYRIRTARPHQRPTTAHLPSLDVTIAAQTPGTRTRRAADELLHAVLLSLTPFSSLHPRAANGIAPAADYALSASLFESGEGFRALMRLQERTTGTVLWARTLPIALLPDTEVVNHIAANVERRLHAAEIERACLARPDSAVAYDQYLRGRAKIRSSRQDENAQGVTLYLKALELEPSNPQFLSAAAEALQHRAAVGWPKLGSDDLALKRQFALRGWENSEYDAVSLSLAGNAMFTSGDPELGLVLTERAAQMNPSSPLVLGCAALSHIWIGELASARDYYDRALRLDHSDPNQRFVRSGLALLHNLAGEHEAALESARQGYALSPGYSGNHWQGMVAQVGLGRVEDALKAFARYRRLHPGVTLDNVRAGQPYRDEARLEGLVSTLALLGMPQG